MSTTTKKAKSEMASTLTCSGCGAEAQILAQLDDPEPFADQLDSWNDEHMNCHESDSARRIAELKERHERPLYESVDDLEKRYPHRPSWATSIGPRGDVTIGPVWEEEFTWSSDVIELPASCGVPGQIRSSDGRFGCAGRRLTILQKVNGSPTISLALHYYERQKDVDGNWLDGRWIDRGRQRFTLDEARQFVDVLNELIAIGEAG